MLDARQGTRLGNLVSFSHTVYVSKFQIIQLHTKYAYIFAGITTQYVAASFALSIYVNVCMDI